MDTHISMAHLQKWMRAFYKMELEIKPSFQNVVIVTLKILRLVFKWEEGNEAFKIP